MKVLLTHSQGAMDGLIPALEREDFEVIHTPLVETAVKKDISLETLNACDWWLFSSRAGVKAVAGLGGDFSKHKLGAVGNGTAKALAKAGGENILVAEEEAGAGLAKTFIDANCEGSIGLPVGSKSAGTIQKTFSENNIPFTELEVYETKTLKWSAPADVDVVLVSSPSAFDAIPLRSLEDVRLLALGETTAQYIQSKGFVAKISKTPSAQSIIRALKLIQEKL